MQYVLLSQLHRKKRKLSRVVKELVQATQLVNLLELELEHTIIWGSKICTYSLCGIIELSYKT